MRNTYANFAGQFSPTRQGMPGIILFINELIEIKPNRCEFSDEHPLIRQKRPGIYCRYRQNLPDGELFVWMIFAKVQSASGRCLNRRHSQGFTIAKHGMAQASRKQQFPNAKKQLRRRSRRFQPLHDIAVDVNQRRYIFSITGNFAGVFLHPDAKRNNCRTGFLG